MKIVRFKEKSSEKINFGILKKDKIYKIKGSIFSKKIVQNKNSISINRIKFLSPCTPSKIIALAINYQGATGHTKKMMEPLVFLKSPNSICSNNSKIRLPFKSNTWGESELGFIIKKKIKEKISIKNAKKYIFGYLPVNDVSCDNTDKRDHHLARSKSADNFCPTGNYIDTEFNYKNKSILGIHNDILMRKGSTNELIWKPEKILSWLSEWMTLEEGDLIITGTPSRVRKRIFLNDKDSYVVKIEGFEDLNSSFYV